MTLPQSSGDDLRKVHPSLDGPLPRIVIENVTPQLDDGRYPVKRVQGDTCHVGADIFKDGHDLIRARLRVRRPGEQVWQILLMRYDFDSDRWSGEFELSKLGRWHFTIDAWADVFGTWRAALQKKVDADVDVSLELLEGADIVSRAVRRAVGRKRHQLEGLVRTLGNSKLPAEKRVQAALDPSLESWMSGPIDDDDLTRLGQEYPVTVDSKRAAFAAWYEMFPRSQASTPGKHGTFKDAERALPRIADLGFDVVYLPPIHPVGRTFRKGRNNALAAGPKDPGSPWAIGNEHGGHTAVEPKLGTIEDFERFVKAAEALGMGVALDYALQCSPDHPWAREHPQWFVIRPDGTIQYAENPPKRYQDIYPLNFWCEDREALWIACKEVFGFWIARGVKTFRVDNPHTKPFAFWEWVIAEVQREYPDVVFLSEAFTRPKRMFGLAKLGFTQSYTHFTWKNSAHELREYFTQLHRTGLTEYFRGNLFTNTPDILHEYLQKGGRPAFRVRLLLAGTLAPLYGIYSGYELCENVPREEGSEEYLNSEKYEIRVRDWTAPGNIDADIRRLNQIRRENRALQLQGNLDFHDAGNDRLLCYTRTVWGNDLLVVVNLDPHHPQEGTVEVPLGALGLSDTVPFEVEDLLTGQRYTWRGRRNFVRLDPERDVGHIMRIVR